VTAQQRVVCQTSRRNGGRLRSAPNRSRNRNGGAGSRVSSRAIRGGAAPMCSVVAPVPSAGFASIAALLGRAPGEVVRLLRSNRCVDVLDVGGAWADVLIGRDGA